MADTKHLELIAAAIGRMAGNGFLVKGWSVTLATAVLGLAANNGNYALALAGVLPTAIFWMLDAYYLALERGFRGLHGRAAARLLAGEPADYIMDPGVAFGAVRATVPRPAVALVHGPLAAVLVLAWAADALG